MNTQKYESNQLRTAGTLLTFVLVCLFAWLSVLVVAIGAQAYEQIVSNTDQNAQLRTSLSYTANKIRVYDGRGLIEARQEGDIDTLALTETIDGELYVTYIYCYNGMLYEWFTAGGTAFDPEQGEALIPMQAFHAMVDTHGVWQSYVDAEGQQFSQFTAVFTR